MTGNIDLATILLFAIPGFFFLRGIGYQTDSDLAYFVYSMFWGILMMVFLYPWILPIEKLTPLLNEPYSGAIILSLIGVGAGGFLRLVWNIRPRFPIEF
jgi:hypothetical protein